VALKRKSIPRACYSVMGHRMARRHHGATAAPVPT
jgi:hypothetical protein